MRSTAPVRSGISARLFDRDGIELGFGVLHGRDRRHRGKAEPLTAPPVTDRGRQALRNTA